MTPSFPTRGSSDLVIAQHGDRQALEAAVRLPRMAERAIELVGAALLLALRLHVAVTAGASTSEFIEFGIGALRRRRVAGRTRHAGGGLGTTLRVFGNLLAADFGRIGAVKIGRASCRGRVCQYVSIS